MTDQDGNTISQLPLSTPFAAYQIPNLIHYQRLEIVGLFQRDPTPTLQALPYLVLLVAQLAFFHMQSQGKQHQNYKYQII